MATYTTTQGDTWDIIAKNKYGSEMFMDVLIKANISHRKTVIFPAGVVLEVPEIDTTSAEYEANLPVWKRTGGV